MRRIHVKYFIAFLVCHVAFNAGIAQKQVSVTVKVHNSTGSSVSLYKVENGEAKRVSFRWPTNNDTCVFRFPLEKEAIFFLGKTGGKGTDHKYVLYLKPGEKKWVNAYLSKASVEFDSCKIVKPNAETVFLQKWTNILNDYCNQGANRGKREQFIAAYSNFIKKAEQLKKKAVLPNKYFNQLFASKIEAEIIYPKAAAFFNFGKRMNAGYDTSEAHKSFYQTLAGKTFCTAGILNSDHGLQLVNYYLTYNQFQQTSSIEKALATTVIDKATLLCNDTIRGAFLTQHMEGVTNYEQFTREIKPFETSFVLPGMKDAYQKKVDELTLYAKGLPAYNFSLYDTKGKQWSLADFKGSIVVLDIWAMWCAPCLAEKPFFLKVEEEFKNRNDIVFIGVSVDGLSRESVWKSFVEKKGWKNIELLSNFDESIMKYYKIEGIPRFMVFDKAGNIVTVDAPRPSDNGFRKLIEQTLKGNN